jgi:hypothetical protein
MNDPKPFRAAAVIALVVTGAAVVYTAGCALTAWEPPFGWLVQTVVHLGELAAVAALALSGAPGSGPVARTGLGTAVLGQTVLTVAELLYPLNPDLGDTLFDIGPLLSGIGMVLVGIAVLRAGRLTERSGSCPSPSGSTCCSS